MQSISSAASSFAAIAFCLILLFPISAGADDSCKDSQGERQTREELQDSSIIIDNHDNAFRASENWQRKSTSKGFQGPDYAFRPTALQSDMASWETPISHTGQYTISARWTDGTNRSASAQYIVHHAKGKTTVKKDQRQNGNEWIALGTFSLTGGTTLRVELSCWSQPGAVVIADAILVQPKSTCEPEQASVVNTPKPAPSDHPKQTTVRFRGSKPVAIGVVHTTELSPEVKAFLDTLAAAEGTSDTSTTCGQANAGYGALFGCFEKTSRVFSNYTKHPEKVYKSTTGYSSAAAGRYQFIPKTWNWVAPKIGATDFSPANQDRAARWLLEYRRALQHVEAIGADDYEAFNKALYASRAEWASLPASPYGQPTHKAKDLWVVYQAAYAIYQN